MRTYLKFFRLLFGFLLLAGTNSVLAQKQFACSADKERTIGKRDSVFPGMQIRIICYKDNGVIYYIDGKPIHPTEPKNKKAPVFRCGFNAVYNEKDINQRGGV